MDSSSSLFVRRAALRTLGVEMETTTSTNEATSAQPERQRGRLFVWFDRRAGLQSLLHESLDEPIPGGARFAYVFGSGLLFIFLSQIITGVFMSLYYVRSADDASTTLHSMR